MHFRDIQDPYPIITIDRFGSGMRSDIFGESDIFATAMDNPKLAICVWDKQNIDNCYAVYERLDFLLRGTTPVSSIPSMYMTNYRIRRTMYRSDLFDDTINAYHFHSEYETWSFTNPNRSLIPGVTVPPVAVSPQLINPADQVTSTFTATAHINLSGQKAVVTQVDGSLIYDDSTLAGFMDRPPYLTLNAATAGGAVTCVVFGFVVEPTWNWVPDQPIYLGANGTLTQTVPRLSAGNLFLLQLGMPSSPTQILWDPQIPIVLS
jgi:hypothetical protein